MWTRAEQLPESQRLLNPDEPFGFTLSETAKRPLPSGLGSKQHPIILKAVSPEQASLVTELCDAFGWDYILGLDRREDYSDMVQALKELHQPVNSYDSCPCGSGEKYKFCCHRAMRKMTHSEIIHHFFKKYTSTADHD